MNKTNLKSKKEKLEDSVSGTKKELVDLMSNVLAIARKDANVVLEQTLNCISIMLSKGPRRLSILNWGTFTVAQRPARTYKQPNSNNVISKPAKNVIKFKPGKLLKEKIENINL